MGPVNPPSHRDLVKISLRKLTATTKLPNKQGVLDALNRLNSHPVGLSEVNSGFLVRLDSDAEVDSLLGDLAEDGTRPLSALGLKPVAPPSVKSSRTILVRNLDPQLGGRDADALLLEIRAKNPRLNLTEVVKIPNKTRMFKIICGDSVSASQIDEHGFKAFSWKVSDLQTSKESPAVAAICLKCYVIDSHPTASCKNDIYCSLCAGKGHSWKRCPNKKQPLKCINCIRSGLNNASGARPHMPLQMCCPRMKEVLKAKRPPLPNLYSTKYSSNSSRSIGSTAAPAFTAQPSLASIVRGVDSQIYRDKNGAMVTNIAPPAPLAQGGMAITVTNHCEELKVSQARLDNIVTALVSAHIESSFTKESFSTLARGNLGALCDINADLPETSASAKSAILRVATSHGVSHLTLPGAASLTPTRRPITPTRITSPTRSESDSLYSTPTPPPLVINERSSGEVSPAKAPDAPASGSASPVRDAYTSPTKYRLQCYYESLKSGQAIAPEIPVYDGTPAEQVAASSPPSEVEQQEISDLLPELPWTPVTSSKRRLSKSPSLSGSFISPGGTPSAKGLISKKQKRESNISKVRKSPEKFH